MLPLLCVCAGSRFRKLVRILERITDVADGVHVDKDDLDVGGSNYGILFWYLGEEVDGTSSIARLQCLIDVVKNPPAGGFGVVTIEYKYFGSAVWVPGGQDTVLRSLLLRSARVRTVCYALPATTIEGWSWVPSMVST